MSNAATLADLAHRLANYIPGMDAASQRRLINRAYVNEAQGHPWSHLIKRFTLQTEAAYNTGMLTVNPGSTGVALAGGTWDPLWTTVPSSRKIAIQGRYEPYDITVLAGGVTGTLGDPWIGDALTTATYKMWRSVYPLPTDCGYSKLFALYDPLLRFRLGNKNQSIFLRERAKNPQLVNYPGMFMVVNQTTEAPPRPQFDMYPGPSSVRAYHGWYFRRPDFMTADAQYPDWPAEFQDMLILSAAIEHYSTPRFHSEKYRKLFMPQYADMYAKMVKSMDGDSALDVLIEEAFTGRGSWSGGNGNWSYNPLSGTGTGMTNP